MKHLYTIIILTCVASAQLWAQQDPLYSQYFNNPMLINPAFAGSNDRLYTGVAYRTQWMGVEGAPKTFNLNSHIALMNNKVGVGIIAVQDQIGDVKNTQYDATGSYKIKLSNSTFSFGMQLGATRYTTDPNAVRIQNPDPLFAQYNETKFDVGAGALLQNERYTLSLSAPRLIPGKVSQGGHSFQIYSQNFYLYGSYNIYLSDKIQFKPSTLLRMTKGSTASADLNCNFVFNQLYTAGVFTRNLNSYGLLVQMVMSNYRFGYVFEMPGKGSALNFTSHEVSLALSMDVLKSHNHTRTGF